MNDRPTPETDAAWEDESKNMLHHSRQLERERDEAREWKDMLSGWGGTPEIVHEFIKGQQARIHAVQDIERELEQAKQDAKQHEVDCLRALGERNEARAEVQRIQHWATVNGTIQMQREITELIRQRDKLEKTLQSLQVACFRIGRGDVNDVGVAVAKMRQKALEALTDLEGGKQ